MKKTKKIFTLAIAIVLICTFSFTTAQAAPETITVKRAEVVSDLVTNKEHGFTIFETTDGQTIYCLDNQKEALKTGQTASLVTNADDGVLYILQNGYPNKKITGNDEMDFYITQAAIWWYMEDTNQGANKLSDEFKNSKTDINNLLPQIKTLVTNAKQYKDNQPKPSMVLKTNSEKLTLTKDKKYYESSLMTATLKGADTYKVTINGANGTTIINENGETKESYNSNEKIKIRIPANELTEKTTITVNFTATATTTQAKIYKTSDNKYQRVAGLYKENTQLEKSTKLTADPQAHICEIIDDEYYGINGTKVDEKTYDKECNKHICEIVDNEYYGQDGNKVDEKTFNEECADEVIVPNTKANISPLIIVLGLFMILSGTTIIALKAKKTC